MGGGTEQPGMGAARESAEDTQGPSRRRSNARCQGIRLRAPRRKLLLIVITWIRPTLRSSPRIRDLWREKHIMAGRAQPRTVASQAGSDAIAIRNVGPAEAKSVRCAGLSLLVRPLSNCRRFSAEQECKRCNPARDDLTTVHLPAAN